MERKTYTKVCKRCGKTFTAKMKQTRFCHSCAGAQCAGRKKAHGEERGKHVKWQELHMHLIALLEVALRRAMLPHLADD